MGRTKQGLPTGGSRPPDVLPTTRRSRGISCSRTAFGRMTHEIGPCRRGREEKLLLPVDILCLCFRPPTGASEGHLIYIRALVIICPLVCFQYPEHRGVCSILLFPLDTACMHTTCISPRPVRECLSRYSSVCNAYAYVCTVSEMRSASCRLPALWKCAP